MDFSEMSGYEFEDFVAELFTSLGFKVTKTPYSGDGGIDLIAERSDPIFSGKYLIQCKNWAGSVGQPEVRDLYGVVTSERANKGILITTSDFTEQAYKFAEGKNLELINGTILGKIASKLNTTKTDSPKTNPKSNFNQERYEYLRDSIHKNPKEFRDYQNIILFLRNYFWAGDFDTCKIDKLFDKIIEICHFGLSKNRAKKHYSRHDNTWLIRRLCNSALVDSYIVTGDLGRATNLLLEEELFYITEWHPTKSRYEKPQVKEMMARNLYAAYRQIHFDIGCKAILSKSVNVAVALDFVPYNDVEIECATREMNLFLSGYFDDSYFNTLLWQVGKLECVKMSKIKHLFFKNSNTEIQQSILQIFKQHDVQIE